MTILLPEGGGWGALGLIAYDTGSGEGGPKLPKKDNVIFPQLLGWIARSAEKSGVYCTYKS